MTSMLHACTASGRRPNQHSDVFLETSNLVGREAVRPLFDGSQYCTRMNWLHFFLEVIISYPLPRKNKN
jgi:hypothetical protein